MFAVDWPPRQARTAPRQWSQRVTTASSAWQRRNQGSTSPDSCRFALSRAPIMADTDSGDCLPVAGLHHPQRVKGDILLCRPLSSGAQENPQSAGSPLDPPPGLMAPHRILSGPCPAWVRRSQDLHQVMPPACRYQHGGYARAQAQNGRRGSSMAAAAAIPRRDARGLSTPLGIGPR